MIMQGLFMRIRLLACAFALASCTSEAEREPAGKEQSAVTSEVGVGAKPDTPALTAEADSDVPAEQPVAADAPTPKVGDCAFNRSDGQYLGPILEVGSLGHRGMADQRAIWVEHPEIGRMDVTYPRNATLGPCP